MKPYTEQEIEMYLERMRVRTPEQMLEFESKYNVTLKHAEWLMEQDVDRVVTKDNLKQISAGASSLPWFGAAFLPWYLRLLAAFNKAMFMLSHKLS